jgi:DNA-binding SARP family transcriptional activator
LLGECRLWAGSTPVAGLEGRKPRELLAFLLTQGERSHHRDSIVRALWPDLRDGRRHLRQAIWQLQKALKPHESNGVALLAGEGDDFVHVDRRLAGAHDVAEVRTRAALARKSEDQSLDLDGLLAVLSLYRGPFLPGWDGTWIAIERVELENQFFSLAHAAMAACARHEDPARAIEIGITALRQDPGRELTHRRMMEAYLALGDRAAALRQYQLCAQALRAEFDTTPERETELLYRRLRQTDSAMIPVMPLRADGPIVAKLAKTAM